MPWPSSLLQTDRPQPGDRLRVDLTHPALGCAQHLAHLRQGSWSASLTKTLSRITT